MKILSIFGSQKKIAIQNFKNRLYNELLSKISKNLMFLSQYFLFSALLFENTEYLKQHMSHTSHMHRTRRIYPMQHMQHLLF